MRKVVFLVGPTAVGKTEVASLLAPKINAEIISCDSMQVYKSMDIISCKPKRSGRNEVPYHLIDTVDPQQEYSAADFCQDARGLIEQIHKRDRLPLVVGGTGLYMNALLDGLFAGPGKNEEIRTKLKQEADIEGAQALYARLKKIDHKAAEKIHPNDIRRIVRALEVYELTKSPISSLQPRRQGIVGKYNLRIFGILRQRQELYGRIDRRVDEMFEAGLVEEVSRLLSLGLSKTASQVIGIKEVEGYLKGQRNIDQAKELLKRNSRRYAKRQITWFKKDKRIEWVDATGKSPEEITGIFFEKLSS
jgi:tRNA dimethylallyltransferase